MGENILHFYIESYKMKGRRKHYSSNKLGSFCIVINWNIEKKFLLKNYEHYFENKLNNK